MADAMFRDYLIARAEATKNELTNTNLGVEEVLAKAKEVLKIENRVKRIDNPIPRKKKTPVEATE